MEKDNVSHYAGVPSSPLSSNINFDARKDGSWTEVAIKTRKFLQMAAASGQGSTLQGYNNELVKCIEDLREKREELNKLILKDEEDKAKQVLRECGGECREEGRCVCEWVWRDRAGKEWEIPFKRGQVSCWRWD